MCARVCVCARMHVCVCVCVGNETRSKTATDVLWQTTATKSLDPSWKSLLYTVPSGIMDIIPVEVKRLLGCESNPLVVVRNLNLVDVCAGKARLSRWATWGGASCCGRSGICSPYGREHLGGPNTRNRANPRAYCSSEPSAHHGFG